MPAFISIVIVVSGIVFSACLLGSIGYNAYEKFTRVNNLTCDCRIDVDSDVFPWQISIGKMKIDSNNLELSYERLQVETHLCGGVLINRNYALVGAHCLRFNYDQRLGVGYGSGDLLAIYDKGRIPISKVIYNSTNQIDDIAIVELESEIDLNNEQLTRPACFKKYVDKIEEFTNPLVSTGWNLIEKTFASKDYFSIQRYHNSIKLKDLSLQDKNCNRKTQICARSKGTAKCDCFPDSSAPLHDTKDPNLTTVIGIHQVSMFKPPNNTIACPEVYFTRLSNKIEFIQSIVGNQICLV